MSQYSTEHAQNLKLAKAAYKALCDWTKARDPKLKRSRFRWSALPPEDQEMWIVIGRAVRDIAIKEATATRAGQ